MTPVRMEEEEEETLHPETGVRILSSVSPCSVGGALGFMISIKLRNKH